MADTTGTERSLTPLVLYVLLVSVGAEFAEEQVTAWMQKNEYSTAEVDGFRQRALGSVLYKK